MLNRVRSLVAVLVLGLPTLAIAQTKQAVPAAPAQAKPPAGPPTPAPKPPTADLAGDSAAPTKPTKPVTVESPTTTFLKQEKYTYCDVKILADYWKTSAKEAKATVGTKLQAQAESSLETVLNDARGKTKLKCTYVDGGFTMKDVKKLSQLWHLSIAEAKSTIELKMSHGTSIYLKQEIRGSAETENDPYTAFSSQTKYTYCDAHMIGTLWGKSVAEGKKAIGTKLVAKNAKGLTKLIADARKNAKAHEEARCSYSDAGLAYDDLAILAKLWKKPPEQMKALVAEKIALGQEATIVAQLKKEKAKQPKPPAPTPLPTPPDHAMPVTPNKAATTKQAPPPGADSVTVPPKSAPAGTKPDNPPATKQATPKQPLPPTKAD